jgi:hypothetical protein
MKECSKSFHKFVKEAMMSFIRDEGMELHEDDDMAFCPVCGERFSMEEYVIEDEAFLKGWEKMTRLSRETLKRELLYFLANAL